MLTTAPDVFWAIAVLFPAPTSCKQKTLSSTYTLCTCAVYACVYLHVHAGFLQNKFVGQLETLCIPEDPHACKNSKLEPHWSKDFVEPGTADVDEV